MTESTVDTLARLALFADLTRPEVEAVSHSFDEQVFAEGERVLRSLGVERVRDPGREAVVRIDGKSDRGSGAAISSVRSLRSRVTRRARTWSPRPCCGAWSSPPRSSRSSWSSARA